MKSLLPQLLALTSVTIAAFAAENDKLPEAVLFATYRPNPDVPYQMLGKPWINHGGVAVFDIDESTGKVIQVTIARSTGVNLLDRAAVAELQKWHFRPHSVARASTAIAFHEPPIPTMSLGKLPNAAAYATYMPSPVYPLEARHFLLDGDGIYRMDINTETGAVTNVTIVTSTKAYALDRAVVAALKKWRFRPHTVSQAGMVFNFRIPSHRQFSMER